MAAVPEGTHITRTVLRLRSLILEGGFAPGERLSELPLVERLGISRTPLRLALAALEHEGLLDRRPTGGYVVREFTHQDIADAIELRGVLEGTAARFAAERGAGPEALAELQAINTEVDALVREPGYPSFARYLELNQSFHAGVLALASSSVLERAMAGILSLPFAGPSAFVLAEAELPESREILLVAHRHHMGIVEAIAGRQSARAESLAREHAHIALTNLEVVLRHREVLARLPGASLIAGTG
jgi:GntR family transcriptional regulator of vanillate catabolism